MIIRRSLLTLALAVSFSTTAMAEHHEGAPASGPTAAPASQPAHTCDATCPAECAAKHAKACKGHGQPGHKCDAAAHAECAAKHAKACEGHGQPGHKCDAAAHAECAAKHAKAHEWHTLTQASCVLNPTEGNAAQGTVQFAAVDGGVKVTAHVSGLAPGSTHAIHIHQYGDCSGGDGKTAGGHYNPEGHDHGLPSTEGRHAGDLGNLQADESGVAHYEIVVSNVTISGLKNPIIGRGVIVHAQTDDGGQPTGNAGGRIACGVIGIAQ